MINHQTLLHLQTHVDVDGLSTDLTDKESEMHDDSPNVSDVYKSLRIVLSAGLYEKRRGRLDVTFNICAQQRLDSKASFCHRPSLLFFRAAMPPLLPRTLPSYPLLAVLLPLAASLIVHPLVSSTPHSLPALEASVGFSLLAFLGSLYVVPALSEAFVEKGLKGKDLLKIGGDFVYVLSASSGMSERKEAQADQRSSCLVVQSRWVFR